MLATLYHTVRYSRCSHLINIENYPRHCWTYETKYKRAKEKQKLERVLIRVSEYPEEQKSLLKKLFSYKHIFSSRIVKNHIKNKYVHICKRGQSENQVGDIFEFTSPSTGQTHLMDGKC